MKQRRKSLARALAAVLCALYAAVWIYTGIFGETALLGGTSLLARAGDVLFGVILLAGAVIWALRAGEARKKRLNTENGVQKGADSQ